MLASWADTGLHDSKTLPLPGGFLFLSVIMQHHSSLYCLDEKLRSVRGEVAPRVDGVHSDDMIEV
jgi:hypothetical protein